MRAALALLGAILWFALSAPAPAQVLGSERVVAVVGNEVILLSELEEQTVIAASEAGMDQDDAAALAGLRRQVLEQMVSDLVVVAAASADDSIDVSETSVTEALEAELNQIRSRFPSPADFEREIARSQWRTIENYRKNLRRIKRRELLAQAFLAKHGGEIQAPPVSDEDVRTYFEENAARLGSKPATVRFDQLDLLARPSETARARARAVADSLVAELRQGADFSTLAREFSADSATAARGGDLGYFGRGLMVPAFEEAAFGIDSVGGLAGPIESAFGLHIIRLDDRQRDEIKARHILIMPETSDADRAAARALGEALVDSLAAGADFDSLRARYSNSPRRSDEPLEGPVNQLPAEWQDVLRDLPIGSTTKLLTTPFGFAILRLEARGGGGAYTFEEIEPRIRTQLAQSRGQRAFVDDLRKQVYVDVRMPEAMAREGTPAEGAPGREGALGEGVLAPEAALREGPAVTADTLPGVEPAPPGGAREAYVPGQPDREPTPAVLPLENPPAVADTPPPDSLPQPVLPPVPEGGPPDRVDPAGAVDSIAPPPNPTP